MVSKPLFFALITVLIVAIGVMVGAPSGVDVAEAEDSAGYSAGPWRCKAFRGDDGIERRAAAWLYRYASTGPGAVVSLPASSSASRSQTTLCAWDPGFAADQWIRLEKERRAHEAQVRDRQRKLQRHKQKGGKKLFPEDAPIEEEDSGGNR